MAATRQEKNIHPTQKTTALTGKLQSRHNYQHNTSTACFNNLKSKANGYARSPAARSSRSPEMSSSGGGSHRSLMLRCDVEELEWGSGSHSAFRPLFAGVSRVARFLLSPAFSPSHVGFRQLFAAYNTCSKATKSFRFFSKGMFVSILVPITSNI